MTEALSSIPSVTHFGRCTLSDLVRSPTFFGNRTLSGPITPVVPMDEPLASSLPVRDAGRCKLLDGQQTTHGPTVHNNRTNLTLCAKSWRPLSGLAQEGRRFSSPRNGSVSKLAYAVVILTARVLSPAPIKSPRQIRGQVLERREPGALFMVRLASTHRQSPSQRKDTDNAQQS